MREVVIVGAARTPIGSFLGELASLRAPDLGQIAIRAALERAGVSPEKVNEVFMGCVLPAGVGQAPARQASLNAGIPKETPCTTINKVCGSGLKAVILGAQAIATGDVDIVVAGGMESMSNVPYYLPTARAGMRLGHQTAQDGMILDGLWDPYNNFHMGSAAELCARERKISREAQDAYATESYRRAVDAQKSGRFAAEIVPVEVAQRKGPPKIVSADEDPPKGDADKAAQLKPAFEKNGTVTAFNASKLNDGAAALVVCAAEVAEKNGWKPLAKIRSHAGAAQAPEWFTTAPAISIERAAKRAGIAVRDIDLFEINEAFAVVSLINNQLLGLDENKVNVNGGAIALGHPIGCSGARVLTTLLYAMKDRNVKRGCASLCIGGGEALAMIVERA